MSISSPKLLTVTEFHPFHFLVKDQATGKTFLHRRSNHGLYSFPSFPAFNNSPQPAAMVGERTSVSSWHSRLRHPAFRVLQQLLSKFQLPFLPNKDPPTCAACFSSKSHQQHFSHSHTHSLGPLDLVYTDVWGPSPICYVSGFKYYVSFLDDFSRYTWLFPIACKSDASTIFNQFKLYVERYFSCSIKSVQSD